MVIDNRILIPFVLPFGFLLSARVLWFLAGAPWSNPEGAAAACFIAGTIFGCLITGILLAEGKTIGHIRIGRKA